MLCNGDTNTPTRANVTIRFMELLALEVDYLN